MKKSAIILLSVLCTIQVMAQKTAIVPQQFIYTPKKISTFDTERLKRIDSKLNEMVDKGVLPHAVVFVAHKGEVVYNKAFGWRDVENKVPCTTGDYFRMASQSKAITVTALLTLFEEGKFLLDEPVKKYIPEFANPQVLETFNESDGTYTTRPAKRDVTIRHLLTHTAGISYGNAKTRRIFDQMGIPKSALYTLDNITLGEVVRKLAKCPLEHDPGNKFTYGMSIDVLGYLAEVISGKPIDVLLKERVFDPLGMKNTCFYLPKEKESLLVKLYMRNGTEPFQLNMLENGLFQKYPYSGAKTFFSTGAGLSGTIEDYARFCQMILNKGEFNGHRVLGRKTVEMMAKNAVGDLRGDIGFGLAFDDFRKEYSYRSICSEGTLRWGGMFNTDYIIDPQEELIVLFYTNTQPDPAGGDYKTLIHNLVYQALK
ncbi:MAG: serine hydrolase domain-containing protein [Paludibacter sp.]